MLAANLLDIPDNGLYFLPEPLNLLRLETGSQSRPSMVECSNQPFNSHPTPPPKMFFSLQFSALDPDLAD
jgi:hypothetical protein